MSNNTPPLEKVLVIGSGPIVIGQAAEFDYAGTQACKALREEGISVVLINSNPATIMTDTDIADHVYIEPLTVEVIERIIDKERPQGILPTLGGQTGLNLAVALSDAVSAGQIRRPTTGHPPGDHPQGGRPGVLPQFPARHRRAGTAQPHRKFDRRSRGRIVRKWGCPWWRGRPTPWAATGGGIANTMAEFEEIVSNGLALSPISQVLLERSLVGWKEIEYEVIRDGDDNCITVCNMENLDPMGAHTGDSIVVAPSQTLTDKEYQMLRSASLKIIRGLGIEGGCNIQMALRPNPRVAEALQAHWEPDSDYYIIEVNPRVSRGSALASKATGLPHRPRLRQDCRGQATARNPQRGHGQDGRGL